MDGMISKKCPVCGGELIIRETLKKDKMIYEAFHKCRKFGDIQVGCFYTTGWAIKNWNSRVEEFERIKDIEF